ncbi:MAG: hypothetical protein P8X96_02495 [Desulfobacteraceae bacterium]
MTKSNTGKRFPARIPPAAKARIVQLSLKHPDFGAKRLLPLLNRENINVSVSSIYNVLKRNGLQTREKRYARVQVRPGREELDHPPVALRALSGATGIVADDLMLIISPHEKDRHPVPQVFASKIPTRDSRPVLQRSVKHKVRKASALKLVCLLLLAVAALIVHLTVLKSPRAGKALLPVAVVHPSPFRAEEDVREMTAAMSPVRDGAIWTHGLPESASLTESPKDLKPLPVDPRAQPYLSGAGQYGGRSRSPWSFNLRFEELEARLEGTRRLGQEAVIHPYLKDNLPAGFTITHLTPDAIWNKMGLQNGDVIQGVNGEAISSPEQAPYFFQALAQGGVVEIKIKRHRRTRYISLTLQ